MMTSIPFQERPRERCLREGSECLSLRECLAVLLGSGPVGEGCLGLAGRILSRCQGGGAGFPATVFPAGEEERAFFRAMETPGGASGLQVPGLGPAGRVRLMAAFELGRRYAYFRQNELTLKTPDGQVPENGTLARAQAAVGPSFRHESREWLGFVPIHHGRRVGELCLVERGVRTHVNVEPSELFASVLALRPAGFYLFHNHPSGDLTASQADRLLNQRVETASSLLGVSFLGHAVVGPSGHRWIYLAASRDETC